MKCLHLAKDNRNQIVCSSSVLEPLANTLTFVHKISKFLVREWGCIVLHYGFWVCFSEHVLQGTEQARGHVRTPQNYLCTLGWKYHTIARGKLKIYSWLSLLLLFVLFHYDQCWTYHLMADFFAAICKRSTVKSHLTYKQRVEELQSLGWRVV